MKTLIVAIVAALSFFLLTVDFGEGSSNRCPSGNAKAFIAIQFDPPYLVGTIPSQFTSDARFFSRRFNCLGRSAEVRRVDLGIYDVRFPGLNVLAVLATALADEGVSASAFPLGDGIVRIALRGPLIVGDVASRRDVPFTVAVF